MPALRKFMEMPPPMVPAPRTPTLRIGSLGVSSGTSGLGGLALGEEGVALGGRLLAEQKLHEGLALEGHALVEGQVDGGLHRLQALAGRDEALEAARIRGLEAVEQAGIGARRLDLVGAVARAHRRALFRDDLLRESHRARLRARPRPARRSGRPSAPRRRGSDRPRRSCSAPSPPPPPAAAAGCRRRRGGSPASLPAGRAGRSCPRRGNGRSATAPARRRRPRRGSRRRPAWTGPPPRRAGRAGSAGPAACRTR